MHIVLTPKTDGAHGFDLVGPFDTPEEASAWLDGREGIVKPLTAPEAHLAHRAALDAEDGEDG